MKTIFVGDWCIMEKHVDFLKLQEQIRHFWEKESVYKTDRNAPSLFSIDTPPPTVSGALHIGHICSYSQTDIIVRYLRFTGQNVFYPFGFDDNGLPTERYVEKRRGVTARQVGRQAFIALCKEEAAIVEQRFEELWRSVGLSVDWDMVYSTIDPQTMELSQKSFLELYKKGFIYRKDEPALYCTAFQTSVAQADLEDVERETLFSDILFATNADETVAISTTRPELLYSCVALLFNPSDPRYKHLAGKKAIVPLFGQEVPIIADDKVQVDKGTGLVMCCTFGDKTDIEWYRRHNLSYRQSIGFDGRMLPETGPLTGLKVPEARAKVLELLTADGLIAKQRTITHSVSIYERSRKEIEYVILPQWFLKILPYKKEILAAADQITWHPPFMKARFIDWVQNLQWDYCISRQRFSGIPFPVWYDKKTKQQYLPDANDLPIDPREQAFPGEIPAGVELEPENDVMDTWNTSSLTPYLCRALFEGSSEGIFGENKKQTSFLPIGMRPQAHDIIRTWAFYTIVKVWMHDGIIPWNEIVISGHVLSSGKEKISKSRENSPLEPENLLTQYPADVARYWAASGSLGHDTAFSENVLKIGQRLITKLWNSCRFAHEHVGTFDPKTFKTHRLSFPLNAWMARQLNETFARYTHHFTNREFGLALSVVEQAFWHDFCDNYLEIIKTVFYHPELFAEGDVKECRQMLGAAIMRFLQLFAPFVPFTTEALYQDLLRNSIGTLSLHQTKFVDCELPEGQTPEDAPLVDKLIDLVAQIRKLKSEKNISLKKELATCIIVSKGPLQEFLQTQEALIKGISQAQATVYAHESTGSSFLEERDGIWHATIRIES